MLIIFVQFSKIILIQKSHMEKEKISWIPVGYISNVGVLQGPSSVS